MFSAPIMLGSPGQKSLFSCFFSLRFFERKLTWLNLRRGEELGLALILPYLRPGTQSYFDSKLTSFLPFGLWEFDEDFSRLPERRSLFLRYFVMEYSEQLLLQRKTFVKVFIKIGKVCFSLFQYRAEINTI